VQTLVAPATSKQHNTIIAGILPVACWRLEDVRFEFDSSFPVPGMDKGGANNPRAVGEGPSTPSKSGGKPGFPLSVFGHADPTGNDDYNKQLSGRRAAAIYGLSIRLRRRTQPVELMAAFRTSSIGGEA